MNPKDHNSIAAAQSPQLPLPDAEPSDSAPNPVPSDNMGRQGQLSENKKMAHRNAGNTIGQGKPSGAPPATTDKPGLVKQQAGGALPAIDAAALLPGTGPGGSLEAVLQTRIDHIMRGYTPAHDAQGPDGFLLNQIEHRMHSVRLDLNKKDGAAALRRARPKMVRIAALALAAIDRTDFIISREDSNAD